MKTVNITATAHHMLAAAAAEMNVIVGGCKPLPDGRVAVDLDDDVCAELDKLDADPSSAIIKAVLNAEGGA